MCPEVKRTAIALKRGDAGAAFPRGPGFREDRQLSYNEGKRDITCYRALVRFVAEE
jgi:hypothetical protein